MSPFRNNLRAFLVATTCLAPAAALAAPFDITTNSSVAQTVSGDDLGTIESGGTLSGNKPITWSLTPTDTTGVVIDNFGTVTATGRAIDTSGSGSPRSFTLNNADGALLTSQSDAFRINSDIGAGTIIVNNDGTISATSTSGGRALSFNAGIVSPDATIQINNTGSITAAGDDAIRPGTGHVTIDNSGLIESTAQGATVGRAINLNTSDLTNITSFSLINRAGGMIDSPGDTVRITADTLETNANYNIAIDNFGTIKSTGVDANNGQAIDFNDLVSTTGTVTITNEASGVMSAADADAVRPGNATINNYGLIESFNGTPTSDGNDAIDFQDADHGTVNNFAGGQIIGVRHGITGDLAQVINNAGVITGQNGSGINIDTVSGAGTVTVVNSATGVITGIIPTGAPAGQDGDGIDVDYLANVTNAGKILAVGMGTETALGDGLNEAIAIGGGSIVNSGLIQSDQRAITVDDSNLGNAFGAITIDNQASGVITGKNGEAIKITSILVNTVSNEGTINGSIALGAGGDTLTNTGTIDGNVSFGGGNSTLTNSGRLAGNVTFGAGNDTLNYSGGGITGAIDGGAGTDTINLSGGGAFTGAANFENLALQSGTWSFTGTQSYSGAATVATGANLTVADSLHTGSLAIGDGSRLAVNGTLSTGALTLGNAATLSANGKITATSFAVGTNAQVALNNTINTGTASFAKGSQISVGVNPAAMTGSIAATGGVTINGGAVSVNAATGAYADVTNYTLISSGGLTGGFDSVSVNLPFLMPTLNESGNDLVLTLTRKANFFSQFAVTPNETAVANALDKSPTNSLLFQAFEPLSGAAAQAAFDQVSGEIHGSISSALLGSTSDMEDAILGRLVQDPPEDPTAFWLHGMGDWHSLDGTSGTFGLHARSAGVAGGIDVPVGSGIRAGIAVGYSNGHSSTPGLASTADTDGYDAALYGEGDVGTAVHLRLAGGYASYAIGTERAVTVPSTQVLTADYDAHAFYGFAEVSHRLDVEDFAVEPLLDLNDVHVSTNSFQELGGSAALSGDSQKQNTFFTTLGARFSTEIDNGGSTRFAPNVMLGWRHASGDLSADVTQAFQGTGAVFTVGGTPISRNAGVVTAGADVLLDGGFKLNAAYNGQFSSRETSNGFTVSLNWMQ